MVVVVDNYDSFTFNLVQRMGELDASVEVVVLRNDEKTVDQVVAMSPDRVIISPGPCTPTEAGISVPLVQAIAEAGIPLLGVCLGHQSIGQSMGARIVRAPQLMHGKVDAIHHDNRGLFAGLPNPFNATRYHSLVIDPATLPSPLEVSAWTDTGGQRQIMGVRHRDRPIEGWQFHPESFLTEPGPQLIEHFLNWTCNASA